MKTWVVLALSLVLAAFGGTVSLGSEEGETLEQVGDLQVSPAVRNKLAEAFAVGFERERISPERARWLMERIEAEVSFEQRGQLLSPVADTLLEGLPVDRTLNKLAEGLARGQPPLRLAEDLVCWNSTLREVNRLIEGLSLVPETPKDTPLLEHTGGALEQYVRRGGDPSRYADVKRAVMSRLKRSGDVSDELARLFEEEISGAQLADVAESIRQRRQDRNVDTG